MSSNVNNNPGNFSNNSWCVNQSGVVVNVFPGEQPPVAYGYLPSSPHVTGYFVGQPPRTPGYPTPLSSRNVVPVTPGQGQVTYYPMAFPFSTGGDPRSYSVLGASIAGGPVVNGYVFPNGPSQQYATPLTPGQGYYPMAFPFSTDGDPRSYSVLGAPTAGGVVVNGYVFPNGPSQQYETPLTPGQGYYPMAFPFSAGGNSRSYPVSQPLMPFQGASTAGEPVVNGYGFPNAPSQEYATPSRSPVTPSRNSDFVPYRNPSESAEVNGALLATEAASTPSSGQSRSRAVGAERPNQTHFINPDHIGLPGNLLSGIQRR